MNYLFVTAHFYPDGAAISSVLKALTNSLERIGNNVYVASVYHPESFDDDAGHVSRALSCTALSNVQIAERFGLSRYIIFAEKLLAKSPLIMEGDFLSRELSFSLYRAARRFRDVTIDAIVPVVGEPAAAKTALWIRERLWPSARLVPYVLDPIVERGTYSISSLEQRKSFESLLFEESDAIVTTKILLDIKQGSRFISKMSGLEFPGIVRPSGMIETCRREACLRKPIECLFSGTLFEDIRNPEKVLEVFSGFKASDVRLNIIGSGCESLIERWVKRSNGSIRYYGKLPLEDARFFEGNADVLVSIGNSVSNQLPSKILNYLSLGKPFLNFYKIYDCPSLEYTRRFSFTLNLDENSSTNQLREDILVFLRDASFVPIPFKLIEEKLPNCTPDYVAKSFDSVIHSLNGAV